MLFSVERGLLSEMLAFAEEKHPDEAILLLRGKVGKDRIEVTDYLFPPFASTTRESAHFPTHMLPIDFSIIGTLHSHPSGGLRLSVVDQHNIYGRVMLLTAYPYGVGDLKAFAKSGEEIPVEVY